MSWLSDAWGGVSGTVGDVFSGVTGAATDLLDSDGAQAALEAAANYANSKMTAEQQKQAAAAKAASASKIPSWALPVGIGSAALLIVALILSRRK